MGALLEARRAAGKVRRCHGDLHLRNICLVDGEPTLFDCLEFSEALASIDVLYDLAFLLMDLEHRGLTGLANRVLNRYLDRTGEDDGLAAMPLFMSLRAGIRAHVTATALAQAKSPQKARDMAAEARRYLDLAHHVLAPQPRRLVAIGGPSGSGKSTLAMGLAPELGLRPGARVLRSDVTRKLLLGAAPETRLRPTLTRPRSPAGFTTPCARRRRPRSPPGIRRSSTRYRCAPAERRTFAEVARRAGVPFSGLWLEAGRAGDGRAHSRPPGRRVRRHPGDFGAPAAPGPGHDGLDPDRRRRLGPSNASPPPAAPSPSAEPPGSPPHSIGRPG